MTNYLDHAPAPRCRHTIGGAIRCSYCGGLTCPTCHHGPAHLKACPETRDREVRRGRNR